MTALTQIQEVNVGLAADIGTLQRLPKITGNDSLVRELALTGRRFGAGEAEKMGFVGVVVRGGRSEVVGESLPQSTRTRMARRLAAGVRAAEAES